MRINVIGASGSGASTIGRLLSEKLLVPHFDCDDYFHAPSDPPFQSPRPPEERTSLLLRDLSPIECWILSGGICGWVPYPELSFTGIVFLYVPPDIRLARLRQREQERFGSRVLPGGDMHASHLEFLHWASRYDAGDVDGKTLTRHEAWLGQQCCPVLRIDGTMPLSESVEVILKTLGDR